VHAEAPLGDVDAVREHVPLAGVVARPLDGEVRVRPLQAGPTVWDEEQLKLAQFQRNRKREK
jgi:hypothetical protein